MAHHIIPALHCRITKSSTRRHNHARFENGNALENSKIRYFSSIFVHHVILVNSILTFLFHSLVFFTKIHGKQFIGPAHVTVFPNITAYFFLCRLTPCRKVCFDMRKASKSSLQQNSSAKSGYGKRNETKWIATTKSHVVQLK